MSSTQSSAANTTPYRSAQSPPPVPSDLGSYSRALLSYTQRQIEGLRTGLSRSEAASGDKSASPPVNVPNGASTASAARSSRRRSPPAADAPLNATNAFPSPASSEFGYRV